MKIDPEKLSGSELPDDSPENGGDSSYEKQKKEAINEVRKLEAELAQKLEEHEHEHDTHEAQDFLQEMHLGNEHKERQEKGEKQKELREMFEEIQTDHIEYPFFRRTFPNFIRICEAARLGKNIPADVVFLAVGIAESLLSVVKLTGHVIADAGRLLIQPRRENQHTKEFVS